MNKLQELSICISSTENNVEITMTKENFDKVNCELERKEKLEKAWEIIKTKRVCLLGVSSFKNVKDYNDLCNHIFENKSGIKYDQLTEIEFNLLKEMLEEK